MSGAADGPDLDWHVQMFVKYGTGPEIFDGIPVAQEEVAEAIRRIRDEKTSEAADFRRYASDAARDDENRDACADVALRSEAEAERYDEALAALPGSWNQPRQPRSATTTIIKRTGDGDIESPGR